MGTVFIRAISDVGGTAQKREQYQQQQQIVSACSFVSLLEVRNDLY